MLSFLHSRLDFIAQWGDDERLSGTISFFALINVISPFSCDVFCTLFLSTCSKSHLRLCQQKGMLSTTSPLFLRHSLFLIKYPTRHGQARLKVIHSHHIPSSRITPCAHGHGLNIWVTQWCFSSFKNVVYLFHNRFAPKPCFYCSKQHPQTLTKLCDFQKTETKYVSGEAKKRSVLIWFAAEAAEKKTWKTQVY